MMQRDHVRHGYSQSGQSSVASALLMIEALHRALWLLGRHVFTVQCLICPHEAGCLLCTHREALGTRFRVLFRMPRRTALLSALPYPLGALSKGAVTLWTHKTARIFPCADHGNPWNTVLGGTSTGVVVRMSSIWPRCSLCMHPISCGVLGQLLHR